MNEQARRASVSHPPIVLIVEDDDSNREMYSAYLESAGYWVLAARNGAEALVEAHRYQPHVVVTDISMPGMDGWELARALRQDQQTAGVRIIAVSGRMLEEFPNRESQRDVDVVLMKPCLPDELLREIRGLIARGRLARIQARQKTAKSTKLNAPSRLLPDRSEKPQRRR